MSKVAGSRSNLRQNFDTSAEMPQQSDWAVFRETTPAPQQQQQAKVEQPLLHWDDSSTNTSHYVFKG